MNQKVDVFELISLPAQYDSWMGYSESAHITELATLTIIRSSHIPL